MSKSRKRPNKLYHLSDECHNGKTFRPRVPNAYIFDNENGEIEDIKTKRICFSTTISGAFTAINFNGKSEILYLHVPEDISSIPDDKIVIPTNEQVWDAEFTREVWVKCKVKLKCIGKVRLSYTPSLYTWRPHVNIKWLEKY